jgi:hypothetical protein
VRPSFAWKSSEDRYRPWLDIIYFFFTGRKLRVSKSIRKKLPNMSIIGISKQTQNLPKVNLVCDTTNRQYHIVLCFSSVTVSSNCSGWDFKSLLEGDVKPFLSPLLFTLNLSSWVDNITPSLIFPTSGLLAILTCTDDQSCYDYLYNRR